jgi:periplasmic protein TonB
MHIFRQFKTTIVAALMGVGATGLALLSGCTTDANKAKEGYASQQWPGQPGKAAAVPTPGSASLASTAKEYRKDAASHLYGINKERIFKGRMPPMLQAVGVLDVDIDRQGQVKALSWKRAPKHVPEVMAEIERMVKAAAPYPAPKNLSQVTYTDVWLWHKSGKFQLDTLTEGQD